MKMDPFHLLDEQSALLFKERMRKTFAGEKIDDTVEYKIKVKDGREMWAQLNVQFKLENREARALVIAHDVTERKRVEAALRAAHEHAAWLARFPDENPNPVVRVAADGQLLYRNPAAIKAPGWLGEEDQKLPQALQAVVEQAMEQGEETEIDLDLGSRIYSLTVMPFHADGYLNVYARDVTQRRAAEIALAETAQKLEQSNRELEQFAFVASHDLQEPLRKIKQFGNSLQQQLQGCLDEETQDSLQRMISATERMQAMIDDLLKLARVNTQGEPFVPVDLSKVAAEVVLDLELHLLRTGGQVVVDQLPWIEADPLQMHQMLQNLLGNGLKFHKPGTPPVVKVSGTATQSASGKGEVVSIRVEDNGIGFDEQQFERILQPFQRVHSRREYAGTGIGLAIVKKIIDRHHGGISVQSTPGTGSTFIVTLPVKQSN
jgi:signal transduction histidine kinase